MVILGLDPGTAATGYGVVEERASRLRAVDFGVVRTAPGGDHAARLAVIHERVRELVLEHQPACVAVEELYVGPNPRGVLAVGQARGAALVACGALGVPMAEYSVATIKTAVCGYGRAEKAQVGQMVRAILGLPAPPSSEHAADALAAAICHSQRLRLPAAAGGAG